MKIDWTIVLAVAIGYILVTATAPLWSKLTAPVSNALASVTG